MLFPHLLQKHLKTPDMVIGADTIVVRERKLYKDFIGLLSIYKLVSFTPAVDFSFPSDCRWHDSGEAGGQRRCLQDAVEVRLVNVVHIRSWRCSSHFPVPFTFLFQLEWQRAQRGDWCSYCPLPWERQWVTAWYTAQNSHSITCNNREKCTYMHCSIIKPFS